MEGPLPRDVILLLCARIIGDHPLGGPLELRSLMRVNHYWHGAIIAHLVRATTKREFDEVFDSICGRVHRKFNVHALLTRDAEHHREFVIWLMAGHLHRRLSIACSVASAGVVAARSLEGGNVCKAEEVEDRAYVRRAGIGLHVGNIIHGHYGLVALMHEKLVLEDVLEAKRTKIAQSQAQFVMHQQLAQQFATERDETKRALAKSERDLRSIAKRLKYE